MAQEYKITRVSEQTPRQWDGPNGTVYYIKVMLEGHGRPVSIGKKAPDALKVGDTVYGDITPDPGHGEDKFKAVKQQNFGGGGFSGGGKREYQPRDDEAIRAQWAIGQAVQAYGVLNAEKPKTPPFDEFVEAQAKHFYSMVDRVKGSNVPRETSAKPPAAEPVYEPDLDQPVNLADIPF